MGRNNIQNVLRAYYEGVERNQQIVTIILRSHERPEYTKIMIECILKQTYSNFFLIVIDNDSKDSTPNVIKSFKDNRIIFIEWKPEYGLITHFAFNIVRTKYLILFHDDDYIEKNYLEVLLKKAESNDNFSCLTCVCDIIDSDGKTTKKASEFDGEFVYSGTKFLMNYYINGDHEMWIPYPAVMYRVSFFKNIKKFINIDAGPAADQYLWMQTERYGGTIAIIGEKLFKYRIHKNQQSQIHNDMEIRLFSFLIKDDYYRPFLINSIKKLSWIIIVSLKMSLRQFNNKTIDRAEMNNNYKKLPKELKRPVKAKIICLLYKFCILFPHISYLLLKKKL